MQIPPTNESAPLWCNLLGLTPSIVSFWWWGPRGAAGLGSATYEVRLAVLLAPAARKVHRTRKEEENSRKKKEDLIRPEPTLVLTPKWSIRPWKKDARKIS